MELLLTKYLKAAIGYRGIQRVETLPVPEVALREAVLNAIMHKDYSIGAPIQIRVHGDHLKIWNPGELPANWSVTNLLGEHSSRPFNPSVANTFFRAGQIEAWGRGVQRIFDACRDAGAPEPRVLYQPGDLWIEFAFSPKYLAVIPAEGGAESSGKTPGKILEMLKDNPQMTLAEVASLIEKSVSAVERASAKLVKSGRLKRVGPAKGGHWEVPQQARSANSNA